MITVLLLNSGHSTLGNSADSDHGAGTTGATANLTTATLQAHPTIHSFQLLKLVKLPTLQLFMLQMTTEQVYQVKNKAQ